jgi:hypothetical protein
VAETPAAEKVKHFSAQTAIEPQSPGALSQGIAAGGQQSAIPAVADRSMPDMSMFDISAPDMSEPDASAVGTNPAAGSRATDAAISIAKMVRTKTMAHANIRGRN